MPSTRVDVSPHLLTWALERARVSPQETGTYVERWLSGEKKPTYKQLEAFARKVHAPFGYFFLEEPPEEVLPLADYRTVENKELQRPSPDLIDTIHDCERKQDWYIDYAIEQEADPLEFVGSVKAGFSPERLAARIREKLELDSHPLIRKDPSAARSQLIERIEDSGVLVVVNGIVGANPHRPLNVKEFRGFALVDKYAPLIFVNNVDAPSAQCFTLIHELAHVWAGTSALSDADLRSRHTHEEELWANRVAAEVLVPKRQLRAKLQGKDKDEAVDSASKIARSFGVSALVVLRSYIDLDIIDWREYQSLAADSAEVRGKRGTGGNFYNSQPYRVSKTLTRALIQDAREGRTLYREAYSLLGVKTHKTFENLAEAVGV